MKHKLRDQTRSLLLSSDRRGGLGDFAGREIFLDDGLDYSDGHRLPHVADGEAPERRVVDERLHTHRFRRRHFDDGGVAVLDILGEGLELFAGTAIASEQRNDVGKR